MLLNELSQNGYPTIYIRDISTRCLIPSKCILGMLPANGAQSTILLLPHNPKTNKDYCSGNEYCSRWLIYSVSNLINPSHSITLVVCFIEYHAPFISCLSRIAISIWINRVLSWLKRRDKPQFLPTWFSLSCLSHFRRTTRSQTMIVANTGDLAIISP